MKLRRLTTAAERLSLVNLLDCYDDNYCCRVKPEDLNLLPPNRYCPKHQREDYLRELCRVTGYYMSIDGTGPCWCKPIPPARARSGTSKSVNYVVTTTSPNTFTLHNLPPTRWYHRMHRWFARILGGE